MLELPVSLSREPGLGESSPLDRGNGTEFLIGYADIISATNALSTYVRIFTNRAGFSLVRILLFRYHSFHRFCFDLSLDSLCIKDS